MIVFDLACADGHRFEGWFADSAAFAAQSEQGLVACPHCGSGEVEKAPMAPAVPRKGNQRNAVASSPHTNQPLPPEAAELLGKLAKLQGEMLKQSRFVGDSFGEDVRAMHYGEREPELVHGNATPDQARELIEEGIEIAPLLFPVVIDTELN